MPWNKTSKERVEEISHTEKGQSRKRKTYNTHILVSKRPHNGFFHLFIGLISYTFPEFSFIRGQTPWSPRKQIVIWIMRPSSPWSVSLCTCLAEGSLIWLPLSLQFDSAILGELLPFRESLDFCRGIFGDLCKFGCLFLSWSNNASFLLYI
jgi:hypothetical protein